MKLHTLGYEGLTTAQVINILLQAKVDTLIDVRELPLSRKKGFSKTAFSHLLESYNIRYIHMRSLGCPRPIRHEYRKDGDWRIYTARFTQYLLTQEKSMSDLLGLASLNSCCLFCFEKDPLTCHRSIVAAYLRQREASVNVVHLNANQTVNPAKKRPGVGRLVKQ